MPELAVIESGKPIPPITRTRSFGRFISPSQTLTRMKKGQSIIVDDTKARACVLVAAKRMGIKVTSRVDGDRYRIWRME